MTQRAINPQIGKLYRLRQTLYAGPPHEDWPAASIVKVLAIADDWVVIRTRSARSAVRTNKGNLVLLDPLSALGEAVDDWPVQPVSPQHQEDLDETLQRERAAFARELWRVRGID